MMSGLIDPHGRTISYLRVSVIDKCNYNCFYCAPGSDWRCKTNSEILTNSEMQRLIGLFVELGVESVRLTGGEPLLRRGLADLIGGLRDNHSGLKDLTLTTNGHLLKRHAGALKSAGLDRVNVSLDTLSRERFLNITGSDALEQVKEGIDEAVRCGLTPLKINTVVVRDVNDHEVADIVEFADEKGVDVRFIEAMPLGKSGIEASRDYVSAEEIIARLNKHFGYDLQPTPANIGAGPANYYKIAGGLARVGVISAMSQHFCDTCNRVRLSASGDLLLCLGGASDVPLGRLMRSGASDQMLLERIHEAIANKPLSHRFNQPSEQLIRPMMSIGG